MKTLLLIPILFLVSCSRESKIKSALSGPGVRVEVLTYRPASSAAPDSMDVVLAQACINVLADRAKSFNSLGIDCTNEKDSMALVGAEIRAAQKRIEQSRPTPTPYTIARYVAFRQTDSEKRVDTLVAVLDDQLRVVWPR